MCSGLVSTVKYFFQMVISIYIPTNQVKEFLLLLIQALYVSLVTFSHSNEYVMASLYGLCLHFSHEERY